MGITANIIADSLSPLGHRVTTFVLSYPRFIHSELMTYRVFSRNAASSRAIPARKVRAKVRQDPARPVFWGSNKPGMQAGAELAGWRLALVKLVWAKAMHLMLITNWVLEKLGLHKQLANRILEPWTNITVIVTSTEWDNFYTQRNHESAQPEIRELARAMLRAHNVSQPRFLDYDCWHLPFVPPEEEATINAEHGTEAARMVSVARAARVSYMNHEGRCSTFEDDKKLFDKLVGSNPKHLSPTEHQARPSPYLRCHQGNLVGWLQFRKEFEVP